MSFSSVPARRAMHLRLKLSTGLAGLMLLGVSGAAMAQTTPEPAPAQQPAAQQPAAKPKTAVPAQGGAQSGTPAPAGSTTDSAAGQDTTTVTIEGKKPANRIDRQTYDNKNNIDSTTGTAQDALNKVPSVNVDPNGNVTLRGNSNVQIYVDGKPSAMMSGDNRAAALQAMSSGDIDSVEVMTNPGAQYSSEGSGGIINLVMKKNRKPGGSGVIIGAVGSDGRYNGSLNGSYHQGKYTFNGGINFRHDSRFSNLGSILQQLNSSGQPVATTQSSGNADTVIDGLSINGGMDYNVGDKDTLSAQVNYSNRKFDTTASTNYAFYNATGAATSRYVRATTVDRPHEDQMVDLSWNHTGDTANENLKADLRLSRSDGSADTYNLTNYSLPATSSTKDAKIQSNDLRNGVFSLDYNRMVGDDQLSTGLQITYDDNRFLNIATGPNTVGTPDTLNAALSNEFLYQQTLSAAYVTYQKQFGDKWTVLGGVRAENLDLKTDLVSSNSRGHIEYTKLNPSFFATYALSAQAKLRFSYSHRLQRPNPQDLNPFFIYVDSQNVSAGNPNLKPQETDSYELRYEYAKGMLNYQFTGYYRKSEHSITSYSTFIADPNNAGNQVLLTSKQNYGDGQSGGVEFNFNAPLTPKLTVNANGNLAYNELTTPSIAGKQSATTLSGRVSLSYKPSLMDQFQLGYFSSGKQLTGQGYRLPYMMGNFSWRHNFNLKTALVLNVNDPFRSAKFGQVIDTPLIHNESTVSQSAPTFYIGLSYLLGGPGAQPPSGQRMRMGGMGGMGGPGGPGGPGGGM